MSQPGRPLVEVLAEIPAPRQARGKRYPLLAVLALACAAMLCGYRSYGAMAEWGGNYGADLLRALGFARATSPCAATLRLIFRRLDRAAVEAALGQWSAGVLADVPAPRGTLEGVACDGKSLRGSRKQGAPGAHLLSAVSHRLGLTVAQEAVGDKTNEIGALPRVLGRVLLAGRVVTVDAPLTQRVVAQTIVGGQGDYVMVAKDNHPSLVSGHRGRLSHAAAGPRRDAPAHRAHLTADTGALSAATSSPARSYRAIATGPAPAKSFGSSAAASAARRARSTPRSPTGSPAGRRRRPAPGSCSPSCAAIGTSRIKPIGCAM